MLPVSVLPSGMLNTMRQEAQSLFTTPLSFYTVSLAYDGYGRQVTASSLYITVTGYIGKLSAKDNELVTNNNLGNVVRQGVKTSSFATVLLPFATNVPQTTVLRYNNVNYRVVWTNEHTQDSVQIYDKLIVARDVIEDERRFIDA